MQAMYVKKFKHNTKSKHQPPIAPNLLNREFELTEINKVWVCDIVKNIYLILDNYFVLNNLPHDRPNKIEC